jgi:ABC-2 type transport system permease protein
VKKIWYIAAREFFATAGTRGFIIGILMIPLMMTFFATVVPRLMAQSGPQVRGEVVLIDPTGLVGPELRTTIAPEALVARRLAAAQDLTKQAAPVARAMGQTALAGPDIAKLMGEVPALRLIERTPADLDKSKEWLSRKDAQTPRHLAVIVIHPDAIVPAGDQATYGTYDFLQPTMLDATTDNTIKDSVRDAIVAARLRTENLDRRHIDSLVRVDTPVVHVITPQGNVEQAHPFLNNIIPFVLLIFLFIGTYTGGGSLLSTTVEEKFNRVMEVLLSAVSPLELMIGKILGQLAVSAVAMALYVGMGMLILSSFALLRLVEPILLLYLLIFFVTTYLTVGALMGAVGAAVNDLRDAQALLTPLNLIMILPYLLALPIVRNPDSSLSVVLSFVPPVNGFAMLLRLSSSSPPPLWEVGLSITVSLAAAVVALWFAAKIFRIALLIQGKPPNIRTFIRWAAAA